MPTGDVRLQHRASLTVPSSLVQVSHPVSHVKRTGQHHHFHSLIPGSVFCGYCSGLGLVTASEHLSILSLHFSRRLQKPGLPLPCPLA
jgi:hypothetical protein